MRRQLTLSNRVDQSPIVLHAWHELAQLSRAGGLAVRSEDWEHWPTCRLLVCHQEAS